MSGHETPVRIIVKKKKGGGAHHGGAWKVALADFMTAMYALFLVLWLVNQSTDVKSAIAGYFQDPLGRASEYGSAIIPGTGAATHSPEMRDLKDVIELRRSVLEQMAEHIQETLEQTPQFEEIQQHVEITMTDDGLRIELTEDSSGVFFETGRPAPNGAGAAILALLGRELGTLPYPVRIEGHTDAWPFRGSGSYTNWELSADRANTARRILTDFGLRPGQISQVTGLADRQPRNPDDPDSPSNRRITITMLTSDEDSRATPKGALQSRVGGRSSG